MPDRDSRRSTEHASLRRLLHEPAAALGIASEIVCAAAIIYVPPLQHLFGTASLSPAELAILFSFPVAVWGADELRRARMRSRC